MYKRSSEYRARQRSDTKRFPYEPIVVSGQLVMPAELQRIHVIVLDDPIVEIVTHEMRAVVERHWPELAVKLPPRSAATVDHPQVRSVKPC
jgi:hypothetical protein